jgi:hypothetical protein
MMSCRIASPVSAVTLTCADNSVVQLTGLYLIAMGAAIHARGRTLCCLGDNASTPAGARGYK